MNQDTFGSLLPPGTTYGWVGPPLESTGAKTITATTDDPTVQAAVDQAAASFVDYAANRATIIGRAQPALNANLAFLAIPNPTAAQASAQITALTRQVNMLIRLAVDDYSLTS
jgi:hypothetical protein